MDDLRAITLGEPCGNTWTPRTCQGPGQCPPVDHKCWTPREIPHVCVCGPCWLRTRLRQAARQAAWLL